MEETTYFFILFMLYFFYKNLIQFNKWEEMIKSEENNHVDEKTILTQNSNILETKYEDKYLNDIRKMEKEYIFNDDENVLLEEKEGYFFNESINALHNRREEINSKILDIVERIHFLEEEQYGEQYGEQKKQEQEDIVKYDFSEDDEELEIIFKEELETIFKEQRDTEKEELLLSKEKLNSELEKILFILNDSNEEEKLLKEAKESAYNFIIHKRLEKIENCYIIEPTPQGNVLMIYDNKRNSFKYFSDNTIPYRYLEVAARKYVKQFQCRQLFVDMEEELKLADEQFEKEIKEKEEKERIMKEENIVCVEKKSVFAKFKSYNKDISRLSKNIPPKNSVSITKEQENKKILLKENANRYTYEGKMANFSFLKKVDRKVVNKKYAFTFADFKKLQNK
jgi:hypothetical protein